MAAAVAAALPALTAFTSSPSGVATPPIAKIAAPPVCSLPCGSSASRASALTSGTPSAAEISSGARTGAAIRTAAASAPAQSSSPTRVTAAGCWEGSVDGNTASATPAALAAASVPPTLVVLPVAKAG